MKYEIALANLGWSDLPEWEWYDPTEFVSRCGISRLAYNMAHLWAWNIPEYMDIDADGPCVFIRWRNDH